MSDEPKIDKDSIKVDFCWSLSFSKANPCSTFSSFERQAVRFDCIYSILAFWET